MSSFQHADRGGIARPENDAYDLIQINNLECTASDDSVHTRDFPELFDTTNQTGMDLVQATQDEREAVRFA